MRIAAISDMHGYLPPIPGCHLLVVAGDSAPVFDKHDPNRQLAWYDHTFGPWLMAQPGDYKLFIGGNHDFGMERYADTMRDFARIWTKQGRGKVVYLQDEYTGLPGIPIWGMPWVPNLPRWAFHANESQMAEKVAMIPDSVELLVTHGPPRGMGDEAGDWGHVGCPTLRERITTGLPELKLHLFGHIHESPGEFGLAGRETKHLNVSHLDEAYVGTRAPVLIDRTKGGTYTVLPQ